VEKQKRVWNFHNSIFKKWKKDTPVNILYIFQFLTLYLEIDGEMLRLDQKQNQEIHQGQETAEKGKGILEATLQENQGFLQAS
jgi:hypothetical protein